MNLFQEVPAGVIKIFRDYDRDPRPSGKAYLVERLWPRGIRHVDAAIAGDVTLLYSSRDCEHNNAIALRDYLRTRTTSKRIF